MSLFDSIAARATASANIGGLGVSGRIDSSGRGGIGISGNGFRAGIDTNGNFSAGANIGGLGVSIGGGLGGGGFGGGGSYPCTNESRVFGGITLDEAKALHLRGFDYHHAKKNLWMIETVSSPLLGDWSEWVNFFAHSVEFTPTTLAGDKIPIGAAVMDTITSAQPIELTIVTRDDERGSLRRWFDAHAAEVANPDGTIGYPANYGISMQITHAFITPDSNKGGFEDKARYRPGTCSVSLSREGQGVEELTMTFIQLDAFMAWR